jgi:formylglycine-generating enzyme required for sulfatase activity
MANGGPPVVGGLYTERGVCPGDHCFIGLLLAIEPIELHDRAGAGARIVGTVARGEWVRGSDSVALFRPIRGFVVKAQDEMQVGDVVYMLDYDDLGEWGGDGYFQLWRRGEIVEWRNLYDTESDEPVISGEIRWERATEAEIEADRQAGAGWWVRVERENGQSGWVREPDFDCMSTYDMPDECRARNFPRPPAPPLPPLLRDCEDCPEMAPIPGAAFAAGRTEVTFAQWDACVAAGGCDRHRPDEAGWGRGDQPVINVSWNDAQAYVQWLSRRTGQHYRLLTQAEWRTAAGNGRRYAWGADGLSCDPSASNGANFGACPPTPGHTRNGPRPVGSFHLNANGLHDVLGNVWEWVEDCARIGPDEHLDCTRRASKGGAFDSRSVGVLGEEAAAPGDRAVNRGFRVGRDN